METLLFWSVPAIVMLIGLKGEMMSAWRLCFASTFALYVGVWIAPAWWGLLDFLPDEMVPYRNALAISVTVAALFLGLYKAATAIAPASHDGTFGFPPALKRILNVLFRFVFGVALSTFIFVLCCATPIKMMVRNNGEKMQIRANDALLRFTFLADKITAAVPQTAREEMLKTSKLWYEPPPPEDKTEAPKTPLNSPAKQPGAPAKKTPKPPSA